MFRYLQPGEKGDYWGSAGLLDYLRHILRGHKLPDEASVRDIEFFLEEFYATAKSGVYHTCTFLPSSIRFLGPEGHDGKTFDGHRININYDVNRVIQSVSLG